MTPPAAAGPGARLPEGVEAVMRRLADAGHVAYVVGGSVRDLCRGAVPADWDVATSAVPDRVQALFPASVPTGERYGTVTVRAAGSTVQVTTFRREGRYSDQRHPDVVEFTDRLEDDLARRDFTINALAIGLDGGAVVDPFGGRRDLEAGVVRAVGEPRQRFAEDTLRILRACRLAGQLEFSIAPATRDAMRAAAAELAGVAAERLRDELLKLMERAARPSWGLAWMLRTGVLAAILPEALATVGVTQNRHHRFDVWTHILRAVDGVPRQRPLVRIAALLHDVAKPSTRALRSGAATFYGHEIDGAELTQSILSRWRFSGAEIDFVTALVRQHMFQYAAEWSDAAVRRFVRRVGEDRLDDLFLLRDADARASGREAERRRSELAALRFRVDALRAASDYPRTLALSGHDVMRALSLPPGPRVGNLLEQLWEIVLEHPEENTRQQLMRRLNEIGRSADQL